ncbi:Na+/H+ antiporter NhaC family protein [Peptoniphilus sp. HMSC062D09]|uniref:Na+/H+ antiporter NhaC family protein n=1 Tax=Peptoniphilus TaxID=162289 RepID=UPI0008A22107|nr:Na+/H+ antiporter NhaC family protein [Peptoniphilus sp. HMSC062D09]OFK84907.1 sodium:proton antiporter [Peptoniphilus sp. HMSC062D09]
MIFTNAVVLSVIILAALCLAKVPVFFSLMISAVCAGLFSGTGITETMKLLIGGMGNNAETALSYILLGSLAYCMQETGAADIMAKKIGSLVKDNKILLCAIIIVIAIAAETIVPIHIAFIPILIPPLISHMNKMKMNRKMLSVSFGFGLKAPYIAIPVGYGAIFQGLIVDSFNRSGLSIVRKDVIATNWMVAVIMLIGLVAGLIFFSRDREYAQKDVKDQDVKDIPSKLEKKHILVLLSGVITVVVQIFTESLPLGALVGLIFIVVTRVIKWKDIQKMLDGGINMMGFIAFVMLIAAGYANVLIRTGAVNDLVQFATSLLGGSKLVASYVMILLGLMITLGIGTSFGTVPIISAIYVPIAVSLGYSIPATILLVTIAAVCGDAGSPASDTTLGPTSGLSVDGQHDHIKDTCVPQFIFYGIPLILIGGFVTTLI